ncbi:cyclic 2,3-diphosphoglycerate synthase [Patescibacteria group bacterium AH-259-L05]|nr:cyclic 2,3-diphosphoglycerate synthase [Patescibacteria group bacterium AH-259-L05]
MSKKKRVVIMGAAGRDFHNFNVYFKDKDEYNVVAFTAAQIPNIVNRVYPPQLAGKPYPHGIPIYKEEELSTIIKKYNVDSVIFSYSDISYDYVMQRANLVLSHGADFILLNPEDTMLRSKIPVIAVCAVRTGCGKSQTTRYMGTILKDQGVQFAVIRHPMPYGDLNKQGVQKFSTFDDLDKHKCTIEEREEYEPHLERGFTVFAGADYKAILKQAEQEAEVILWDGGNNDYPFIKPDLMVVLADPHRPGHELLYYPSQICAHMADVVVINKINTAKKKDIEQVRKNITAVAPKAKIILAASPIFVSEPQRIKNKRVLVIEDGPTVTHGGASFGAGFLAAHKYGARIVDPRAYAKGSLKKVFQEYTHLRKVLPAMGYGEKQVQELEETINACPADIVITGTPIDLSRIITTKKPIIRARYELEERSGSLEKAVEDFLKKFVYSS